MESNLNAIQLKKMASLWLTADEEIPDPDPLFEEAKFELLSTESNSEDEAEPEYQTPYTLDLTSYPKCGHLVGSSEKDGLYLSCYHIFREIGNNSSRHQLRDRCACAKGLSVTLHRKIPNVEWAPPDWRVLPNDDWWQYSVHETDLPLFLEWAQARTRKGFAEKERLLRKFNVDPENIDIRVPIETSLLDTLSACLPFAMERQHRVGKYRLDAFIPRLRIAIQIDEKGHSSYDLQEEKTYEQVIRDENMVLIRFNPDDKRWAHAPAYELIKQVWNRTISPDFVTFRQFHQLV